ncbi:glycosyltransferase [Alkalihalobacillus sp. LMS6]|uniref:glycosyltransferase n=1 Tax=Alkalihalobacillus sp. LMS6 TaxID=2924034 RepID=UPI0020D17BB0|nr:glycosyltransferase [Alkalihalobacillus sp. LMS6]UTR06082.1 glycosyltransferase [Alkalihalobacillus sp. LMS6]
MESKNIVLFSHTFMGGAFVVGSHHYAKELAKKGHKVLHISTPITKYHFFKNDMANSFKRKNKDKLIKISENCFQLIPYSSGLPWSFSKYFFKKFSINYLTKPLKKKIKNIIEEFYGEEEIDYLVVDQPTMIGMEKFINYKKLIYRATDVYSEMMEDEIVIDAEKHLLNNSNGMISTSPTVEKHLMSLNDQLPKIMLENAAELDHFKRKALKPEEINKVKGKIAVYVGALDKRFDFEAIKYIANSHKELNIIIIGPVVNHQETELLKTFGNIFIIGPIDYSRIPSFLQHSDIALLPLSNHPSNDGRSPMKLYEYLATGLPVVCKVTDDIKLRNLNYVYFYDDNKSLETALLSSLDSSLSKIEIEKSIGDISWKDNTNKLLDFLSKL